MCTYTGATFCGDGVISGGETCDCGDVNAITALAASRPYGGSLGSCIGRNGTYGASPNTTCGWDCSGAASYCGDETVDSGESCDGESGTWSGKLCATGFGTLAFASSSFAVCTVDADCSTGETCGGGTSANAGELVIIDDCPTTYVCTTGPYVGEICDNLGWDCDSGYGGDDGDWSTVSF